jgi:hypothetical protein
VTHRPGAGDGPRRLRATALIAAVLMLTVSPGWPRDIVVVEDWSQPPPGLETTTEDGQGVLRLRSTGAGAFTALDLTRRIDLEKTPVLEWSWRVARFPARATWVTERRNIRDDYQTIFGEPPGNPDWIRIGLRATGAGSVGELLVGPIVFRAP